MNEVPTISPVSAVGAAVDTKFTRTYNNPAFDYMSETMPRNIKDMFRWCEMVYNSTPIITNGVKKLINYPLTDFVYKSDSEKIREETKELVEKTLKMRSKLIQIGVDYYIYGNAFRNMYFPFDRYLECKTCGNKVNIKNVKAKLIREEFEFNCSECKGKKRGKIVDEPSNDLSRIRLVEYDPKAFELFHNPVTGTTAYYYAPPKAVIQGVASSDPTIINDIPEVYIRAALKKKQVQMGENFYHFKAPGLSGYSTGWGIAPLLPTLKPYMYIAVLRKASEAIGLEHITPQRILFPQATTSDPSIMTSMAKWREEMQKALKNWRRDPNYTMLAPFPTGTTNVGSQGRNLIPTAEIKEARNELALALDIPPEFIFGTTSVQNSTVALRILENQLTPYVDQLEEFINWVIRMINSKFNKNFCEVELADFTLVDDMVNKQILMNTAGTMTSAKTVQESLGLDPDEERENMIDEQIQKHKDNEEVERRIAEAEKDIGNQAMQEQQAEESGTIPQYNQQKLYAHAQNIAAQLIGVPYEERKSLMSDLEEQDFVMYAMVAKLLDKMHDKKEG